MAVTRHIAFATAIIIVLTTTWAPGSQPAAKGTITVTITELRNTDGHVLISLYNKAEGFPKDHDAVIQSAAVVPEDSGQVTVAFENLPYGDYAIAVLHDEDFNGDMTFGAFHLPKEGYCFSNNVKVRLKAPKFEKARFLLDKENVTQTLRVRY